MLVATVAALLAVIGPSFWAYRRGQAVEATARSLVSGVGQEPETVPDGEWRMIWDLATNRDDAVRLRFLGLALCSPAAARRFNNRAALLTHAAVGLDPDRRRRALDDLVLPTLRREGTDPEVRMACARIGVALEDRRPEFAGRAADAIRRTIGKADRRRLPDDLAIFQAVEPALNAEDKRRTAAAFADRAAAIVAGPEPESLYLPNLDALVDVVRAIENHLSPQAVSRLSAAFVECLLDELPEPAAPSRTAALIETFKEMAGKLDAATADGEAERVAAMSRLPDKGKMPLAVTLRALSLRQDGTGLDRAARRVIRIIRDTRIDLDDQARESLGELFRELADRLGPGVAGVADDILAAVPGTFYSRRPALADAFLAFADRLEPRRAEALAAAFSGHFPFDLARISDVRVSRTYASVTRRLAAGDRGRLLGSLIDANMLGEPAWTLFEAGAATIGDREAARLAAQTLAAVPGPDTLDIANRLRAFVVLVQRTSDEDGQIASAIARAVAVARPRQLAGLGQAIRDAGERLDAGRVKALARAVAARALDGGALDVTAPLLDQEGAADVAGRIVHALTVEDDPRRREGIFQSRTFRGGNPDREEDAETRRRIRLLEALGTLAGQLDGTTVARAVAPIGATLSSCQTPDGLESLATTLTTLAKILEDGPSRELASAAIRRALAITSNLDEVSGWSSGDPPQLAKPIRALGPLVEETTASEVAGRAVKAMPGAKDVEQLASLVELVRVLAGRMGRDAARQVVAPAATLLVVRIRESEGFLRPACASLEDLAGSLDPQTAVDVAGRLLDGLVVEKKRGILANLDRAFCAVAARLDAQGREDIARRLEGEVSAAGEARRRTLAGAFQSLAPRLDTGRAGSIKAALLTRVSGLAGAASPTQLFILSETIASLADIPEVATSRDAARAIADRVAGTFRQDQAGASEWDDLPDMMRTLVPRLDPERAWTLKHAVVSLVLLRIGVAGDQSMLNNRLREIQDAAHGVSAERRALVASRVLDTLSDPARAGSLVRRVDERMQGPSAADAVPVSQLLVLYTSLTGDDESRLRDATAKAADQMIRATPTVTDESVKGLAEVFRAMAGTLGPAWATDAAVRIVDVIGAIEGRVREPEDRAKAREENRLMDFRSRQAISLSPSDGELRATRIGLLVEMFRCLSGRVDRVEANRLAGTLVAELAKEPENPQFPYRLKLVRELAGRVGDASAGQLAARLIAIMPPYRAFEAPPESFDVIRRLAAHTDAPGSTLIFAALL